MNVRFLLNIVLPESLAGCSVLAALALAAAPAFGQSTGIPEDWSHHHVVYSTAGSLSDAMRDGWFSKWYAITSDPRFRLQQLKRNASSSAVTAARDNANTGVQNGMLPPRFPPDPARRKEPLKSNVERDWNYTLGATGVAAGTFPAKYNFSPTATPDCLKDFLVFGINASGSTSQANLIGFNNLYSSSGTGNFCTTTGNTTAGPSVLFAYNVGTGTINTSPVLSLDGTKVAYILNVAGSPGTSTLHVLTFDPYYIVHSGSQNSGCTATTSTTVPCNGYVESTHAYLGATHVKSPGTTGTGAKDSGAIGSMASNTSSSIYVDYASDTAYVGDNTGKLYKFTTVFTGTPTEAGSPWPIQVATSTTAKMTSPVFDGTNIWIADSGGFVYKVVASSGALTKLATALVGPITDSPVIDPIAGTVYVFTQGNATTSAAVHQYVMSTFTTTPTGTNITVGTGSTTIPIYAGAFDNTYFTSGNGAQPAGNLYACGNTGGDPTLYKLPISYSSGPVLGAAVTGPVLASSNSACSPLTEFNNTSDWLFASVPSNSCGGTTTGCVVSFDLSATLYGPWTPSTSYAANAKIVDTSGNVQQCTAGCTGTSSTTVPSWSGTNGGIATDPSTGLAPNAALSTVTCTSCGSGTSESISFKNNTASSITFSKSGTNSNNVTLSPTSGTLTAGSTGTITFSSSTLTVTITIGSIAYNLVATLGTGTAAAPEVTNNTSTSNGQGRTASNLYAAMTAVVSNCYLGTTCFNPNAALVWTNEGATLTTNQSTAAVAGTGGMVIDNSNTTDVQASSFYYGTLTGALAEKLTQSALQ